MLGFVWISIFISNHALFGNHMGALFVLHQQHSVIHHVMQFIAEQFTISWFIFNQFTVKQLSKDIHTWTLRED